MDERKLLKKSDLFVILIIAVAAVCMLVTRQAVPDEAVFRVLYDGKTVKTASLGEYGSFHIPEAPLMEFEVRDGKIAVSYSDCPDKVCVRTGFIGQAGQKIVCLPNRIVVSIDTAESGGYDPDEPDTIAY